MQTSAPLLGEPLPVELMNTLWADRDGVHDALAKPSEAAAWLQAIATHAPLVGSRGLEALSGVDVERLADRLRPLRDALRRLAAVATGDPREAATSPITAVGAAVAEINTAAAAAPRWSSLHWQSGQAPSKVSLTAGPVADGLVSAIAEQAVDLFADERRLQLRACLAPGCVLYFIKGHPRREWCSAGCGNRARVARHYRRHHPQGPGDDD
jgi:predicted RNA-binding Zn ribbon-like protein